MTRKLIEIDLVDPNPYQPRESEDPAKVTEIAESILADGLLQDPSVRKVDGRYQLVFGHTRKSAILLLRDTGKKGNTVIHPGWEDFTKMPANVVDLDNEQMFRQAMIENTKRKDLTPIETAKAMKRYKDEFGHTSAEIGALFGCNDATVRGTIRLLDLPVEAQVKVGTGELSQATARKLLALTPILKPDALQKIALELAAHPGRSDDSVNWDIRRAISQAKAPELRSSSSWPADWTPGFALSVNDSVFKKSYRGPAEVAGQKPIDVFHLLLQEATREGKSLDLVAGWHPEYGAVAQTAAHLAFPPGCSKCEYAGKFNGATYCGLKACFERKQQVWLESELELIAQQTGLAPYDPGQDPSDFEILRHEYESQWSSNLEAIKARNAATRARFDAKDKDLRLMTGRDQYSPDWLTESNRVVVIDVSKAAQKRVKAERKRSEQRDQKWKDERALSSIHNENRDAARAFVQERALQCFVPAFDALDNLAVLSSLTRMDDDDFKPKTSKADRLRAMRVSLAAEALGNNLTWEITREGPVAVAKHLQGVATTWGVDLPETWLEVAQEYEIVRSDAQVAPSDVDQDPDEELDEELELEEA